METPKQNTWSMTEAGLQTNLSHLSTDDQALAVWCYRWCNDPEHPISLAEFARQIGSAQNTIYKVFTGKYYDSDGKTRRMPPPRLLARMQEFKSLEEKRWKLGAVKFCNTETSREVFRACDHARESRTPVFLYGASHIGKTMALREYQFRKQDNLTYYVRMRAASGLVGIVKLIAKEFGISPKHTKDQMVDQIVSRLTPNSVLILDECHLLTNTYRRESFFNCFETIRDIYDAVECGFVLSFTNIGRDKVERERRGELEQLFRRGIHRFALGDQPLLSDLKVIARNWGMEYPKKADEAECPIDGSIHKPYEMIRLLTRNEGLKSFTERLRYARKLSQQNDQPLSWDHFVEAHVRIHDNAIAPKQWN